MLDKIKGLMESEKNITKTLEISRSMSESAAENHTAIEGLKEDMQGLKKEFKDLSKVNQEMLQKFKEDIISLQDLRQSLKDEVMDFKLLKTTLQQKLIDDISFSIRNEISSHCERLKTDVKSYNDLKQQLQTITALLEQTKSEIARFCVISKGIKESDFKLNGYQEGHRHGSREASAHETGR